MEGEDTSTGVEAKESRKPFVHFEKRDIGEVLDYFAKDFTPRAGMVISRIVPHYDPRTGVVIFEMYLEPEIAAGDWPKQ